MKPWLIAAAALVGAAVAGEARADEWRVYHGDRNMLMAADLQAIRIEGPLRRVRMASLYPTPLHGADYSLIDWVIDCERMTAQLVAQSDYTTDNRMVREYADPTPARPVAPSSVASLLYYGACRGQWPDDHGLTFTSLEQLVTHGRRVLAAMPAA